MKRLLFVCVGTLCLVGCQQIDLSGEGGGSSEQARTKDVQFVIKNLSVDYVATRSTVQTEGMTDLYIWEGSTLLKHQVSTDSDFGTPTVSLTIGAHDLTFVTSKSTGQAWSDGVWSCSKVGETFGTVLEYTVSGSSTSKQVQLDRVNGSVKWTIEDVVPSTATTASVNIPQYYGLDASLNGVQGGTYSNSFAMTSVQGVTGVTLSVNVLPEDHVNGSTISPTITISDGANSICSYTNEVTITPNVVTNIHGNFFTGSDGLALNLSTEWGTQNDVSIR